MSKKTSVATRDKSAAPEQRREEFEYIVVGSGAGGGPVAANLAKAGKRVLVLEAGGDGNNAKSLFKYAVSGSDPRLDPELGWSYWVNSRARKADREKQHFYVPEKDGLYYPRGTSIGGSTCVNAMIALYPDNKDWDDIAKLTGDRSWNSTDMRSYCERLERVRYAKPQAGNPERHGYKGWLALEQIGTKNNLAKDKWLADYVASRVRGQPNGRDFEDTIARGEDFRDDPNDWSFVNRRGTGMADPPRAAENGARRGTRELLLSTAEQFPKNLTIRTDCLVMRLLFDEARPNKVVGVEYLEGPHLYGASLLADEFASRPGIKRHAFAAREVIISTGAFNSPQLLMLSGIGPKDELKKHGIAQRINLPGVGKNLQDRLEFGVVAKLPFEPQIYEGCTWGAPGDPCLVEYDTGKTDGAYRSRLARQMYMIDRSSPDRDIPNIIIFGFTANFRGFYHPTYRPPSAPTGPAPKDQFTWFTLSGHTQNTGGTVTLKSASPRDTAEINFNNFEDGNDAKQIDITALLNGVKAARRMAAAGAGGPAPGEVSPGKAVQSDKDLKQFIKNETWGHHASCSNKMGPASDPLAVVDSNFKVHGAEGLRIIDASVFPRVPGLFIVLPIYMISEKASDVILADAAKKH